MLDGSNSSSGPNFTYNWELNATNQGNTPTINVNQPGLYTLTVTNIVNGCTETESMNVNQDIVDPVADAGNNDSLTCQEPNITLDGTNSSLGPNFIYEWVEGGGSGIVVGNNITEIVNQAATYVLTVIDTVNGCAAVDSVIVDPNLDAPVAVANASGILTCEVLEIDLDAIGSSTGTNISYTWLQDSTIISLDSTVEVNEPQVYTLIVTLTIQTAVQLLKPFRLCRILQIQ